MCDFYFKGNRKLPNRFPPVCLLWLLVFSSTTHYDLSEADSGHQDVNCDITKISVNNIAFLMFSGGKVIKSNIDPALLCLLTTTCDEINCTGVSFKVFNAFVGHGHCDGSCNSDNRCWITVPCLLRSAKDKNCKCDKNTLCSTLLCLVEKDDSTISVNTRGNTQTKEYKTPSVAQIETTSTSSGFFTRPITQATTSKQVFGECIIGPLTNATGFNYPFPGVPIGSNISIPGITRNPCEACASYLVTQTQNTSLLSSSQVDEKVGELGNLLDCGIVTLSIGQKAINAISNLIRGNTQAGPNYSNRLIETVDELGLKLDVKGDSEKLSSDLLVLVVKTVNETNFRGVCFTVFNITNQQVTVPGCFMCENCMAPIGSVLLPPTLTKGLSPEEKKLVSRVQFTFYQTTSLFQGKALGNQILISPVIGSSVANLSITNLINNIQFTLEYSKPVHGNYKVSCVFWNFSLNGGGGGWSTEGCYLLTNTESNATCSCNHLTSFAILLDLSREGVTDPQQELILTFITYIGCGISAILLSFTLLTYIFFQTLRQDIPSKILVQLCLSLFLLNMVFLLDGWLALYSAPGLCTSTAFFLHYFLLTSFTWAGLDAFHMYHSIIRVYTPYVRRYMLKFSLVGWGLPLIIVIIVISVDKDNYGLVTYGRYTNGTSDDFCWLHNNIAFYVTVVGYFLLVFVLSLIVFIVVLVQLARMKKQNPQNTSPHRSLVTDLRSIAGLVILLGLTWGFALFAWGPLYLPFIYLFPIFNSLLGLFLFVFYCAMKESVRRQWRTHLCPGSSSLDENSGWSWKASPNGNTMSSDDFSHAFPVSSGSRHATINSVTAL